MNIALGPTINILRIPEGGRDYEAFGEDPVLTSSIAAALIPAGAAHGLIMTAKHLLNHEDEMLQFGNFVVDDRTEREVYLAPFAASLQAGATAVMCASNQETGLPSCANRSAGAAPFSPWRWRP